jgi:hypothetical protein
LKTNGTKTYAKDFPYFHIADLMAHIGHMKTDGKLGRNFLKGIIGDQIHALLCGMGHNMRMLANFIKKQYSIVLFKLLGIEKSL